MSSEEEEEYQEIETTGEEWNQFKNMFRATLTSTQKQKLPQPQPMKTEDEGLEVETSEDEENLDEDEDVMLDIVGKEIQKTVGDVPIQKTRSKKANPAGNATKGVIRKRESMMVMLMLWTDFIVRDFDPFAKMFAM